MPAVGPQKLDVYIAGQIPYFYRNPHKIAEDFRSRHSFIDMLADLATKVPTSARFQQSHCGEIACSLFLEDVLNLRRLYSKLTLTTSENTNIHKMDGFFIDMAADPYEYIWVEAKSSIMPTGNSTFRGHRYGILQQMLASLSRYEVADLRFDLVALRDNLERSDLSRAQTEKIRSDLVPPGPQKLRYVGMAAINRSTLSEQDDDFILTAPCSTPFSFEAIVVGDLAALATAAYARVASLRPTDV